MQFKITWNYIHKRLTTSFLSDWIPDQDILPIIEDIENTGRVKEMIIEDETGVKWTKKDLKKLLVQLKGEPDNIIIYFDGNYEKHTAIAGIGVVIYYKLGNEYYRKRINARLEQLNSNNEAEYAALYFALEQLEMEKIKGKKVKINGDSQGLLKQLMDEWPCYEENLNRWLDRIEDKIKWLNLYPTFEIIGRNNNKEAHKLASQAIENIIIESTQEINGY
ncbi:reverse transcriptase-like protein [Bacillus kwashiorkori]|uniref:reverse transcriptase-like protein n=1 Tax=Bacillus kwashiorkori TaxID=1522318 RepID=UPI0007833245|nr:reverse transcriptase-like protein [Bacillus kwashiorkori]